MRQVKTYSTYGMLVILYGMDKLFYREKYHFEISIVFLMDFYGHHKTEHQIHVIQKWRRKDVVLRYALWLWLFRFPLGSRMDLNNIFTILRISSDCHIIFVKMYVNLLNICLSIKYEIYKARLKRHHVVVVVWLCVWGAATVSTVSNK
jgi:hypothetical protein